MDKGKQKHDSSKSVSKSAKDTKRGHAHDMSDAADDAAKDAAESTGRDSGKWQPVVDPNVPPVAPVVPAQGQPVTTPRDVTGEAKEGAKFRPNDAVTFKGQPCRVVSLKEEGGKTYSLTTADGRHSFDADESELEAVAPPAPPREPKQ